MNYYNEHDRFAAAWLRELIKAGLIPHGEVDERDIQEVQPHELDGYTQVHLFAGIGGWSHALDLAGWPRDRPVWTGSCPCQPFSDAGLRHGHADPRHLWPEMRRLICELRPPSVFGEQVASGRGCRWLAGVFADLEAMEYRVAGADLCAAGEGAPHIRQRLFWVADTESGRTEVRAETGFAVDCDETSTRPGPNRKGSGWADSGTWDMRDARRRCERGTFPLVDGISERMDIIAGYGNAIVPQVAATFVRAYMETDCATTGAPA